MSRKRLFSILTAGVLAASVLAGCGSSASSTTVSSAAEADGAAAQAGASSSSNEGNGSAASAMDTSAAGANADNADANASDTNATGSNSTSEASSSSTAVSGTAASGNSRSLIVYFDYSENMGDTSNMDVDAITSASLAGSSYDGVTRNNLQVMKDEIQKQTGADVFSVRVTEPYDPDYNTMVGVAQEDQDNNKQFTFVEALPDLSNYDTIYMGTPVWWGGLPQPMVCLLDQYDFSDKVIIPFGIHLGSRFGRIIQQYEEAEPGALVNENGLTENAHTPNDQVVSDVDAWLAGL